MVGARDRRLAATKPGRSRVPHHGRKVFKDAPNLGIGETGISQPQLESLNCVRDCACVQTPQRVEVFDGYSRLKSHANPFHKLSISFHPITVNRAAKMAVESPTVDPSRHIPETGVEQYWNYGIEFRFRIRAME